MMGTLTLELREAAKACSNVDYREQLRQVADSLSFCADRFAKDHTADRLRDLNGAWALAERVLKNIPPEGDPSPLAGSPEPARLAA